MSVAGTIEKVKNEQQLLSRATRSRTADERVMLIVSTMIGLATVRYVLRLPGSVERDVATMARLFAPAVQRYIVGKL